MKYCSKTLTLWDMTVSWWLYLVLYERLYLVLYSRLHYWLSLYRLSRLYQRRGCVRGWRGDLRWRSIVLLCSSSERNTLLFQYWLCRKDLSITNKLKSAPHTAALGTGEITAVKGVINNQEKTLYFGAWKSAAVLGGGGQNRGGIGGDDCKCILKCTDIVLYCWPWNDMR